MREQVRLNRAGDATSALVANDGGGGVRVGGGAAPTASSTTHAGNDEDTLIATKFLCSTSTYFVQCLENIANAVKKANCNDASA